MVDRLTKLAIQAHYPLLTSFSINLQSRNVSMHSPTLREIFFVLPQIAQFLAVFGGLPQRST
jgi:hypothetical protein